jgi:hypothetical protein
MSELTDKLRGLVFSAVELREKHPDWDDAFTEDYLSIIENIVNIANEVDLKNDIIKTTVLITFADTPYTPLATDEEIFIDTDDGPIDITLPVGIDGTNYRMINVGSSKNNANLIPALTDKVFGVNASEKIADAEVLIMTFEDTEGWY